MEFKKLLLKDCLELIIDHRGKTPKKLGGDWINEGVPVISAKNVKNGFLKEIDSIRFINEEMYNKWMKEPLLYGDILLVSEGATFGESMMWRSDEKVALGQRLFGLRTDCNILDNRFFSYYITSKNFQHEILSRSTGTSVIGIKQSELIKTSLELPNIKIQRFIGGLVDNIQNKIILNKQQIANLEELSQTLFKRWFVDFEFPNEEGDPFKSSGGKLVNSELGDIPEGWEVKQLKNLAHHKKDTFNPNKAFEEQVYHFSLPAYDTSEIPVIEQVSEIKSNKWHIDKNCVLFSKMNPRTMRVWLPDAKEEATNVCSTEFVVLESDSARQNSFIYNICKSDNFAYFLQSNATGSTNSRQRIRPNVALDYKLAINTDVMEKLATLLEPYTNKMIALRNEISILSSLRDTLLPKLMSGEIELPDDLEVEAHAELLQ